MASEASGPASASPSDPFGWAGATIDGKLEVLAVAGEGTFGIVYRGVHLGFDEPVAIKCLKLPLFASGRQQGEVLASFRSEARLLHRLSRRTTGIVQALDIGAATSPTGVWTPYLVMEWLEGRTLEQDIAERRRDGRARSLDEAIELLRPALEAVAVAHEEGVIHRDLKPGNIFLVGSAALPVVKVVDFGIAKVMEGSTTITRAMSQTRRRLRGAEPGGESTAPLPGSSLVAFTPEFAAPEQFSVQHGATGPWTDVFAMALVLLEAASQRPTARGADLFQLYAAFGDERTRPTLQSAGLHANEGLRAVIDRALAVDPAQRFTNMGELLAALDGARGEASVGAAPSTAGRRRSFAPAALPPSIRPAAAVVGENRLCTLLAIDVPGLSRMADRLTAEEQKEAHDAWLEVARERATALGGVVSAQLGGGALVVFGAQRASDHDAERALRAALEASAAVAKLSFAARALRGFVPELRAGISTGRVFAESAAGDEARVAGEPVRHAAQLRDGAAAGAIVIGRETLRHVAGRFRVEAVAGVDGAAESYRVLGPAVAERVLAPADFHGAPARLVGRAAELARLVELLETVAAERRAALATVVGAPGLGRTRLLAELVSRAATGSPAFEVLSAQCSPLAEGTSYALVAALLRGWLHIDEDDRPDTVLAKLRAAGRFDAIAGADLEDVALALTSLLGEAAAPSDPHGPLAPADDGDRFTHRVASAIASLLRAAAADAPVALLCDDVDVADEASLELLRGLVFRLADAPVVIVCSARPELLERRPGWSDGLDLHVRVDLAPLARRHIEEMARDRLAPVAELPADLVRNLADRAEGNPLILVESLHLLVDAGVVVRADGAPWTVRGDALETLALPGTVAEVVQARLDRLPPEDRAVLGCAAVVGRTFWEGAIEHLYRTVAGAMPTHLAAGAVPAERGVVASALARLRDRHLVRARDVSSLQGERELVFAEWATQEVAYETWSARVRAPLHRAAAVWLERHAPGDAWAAQLALHHDRGGDLRRAAEAHARAAAHAGALGRNADALRHLARVREIHVEAEGTPAATSGADRRVASWRERARLRLELGDALRRAGKLDEAERAYDEARRGVLAHERRPEAAPEPAETIRWEARLDSRLALLHKVRGDNTEARALIERAIARAAEGGAVDETPALWAMLSILHRRERDPIASQRAALAGLRVARGVSHRDDRFREDVAQLLLGLAVSLYSRKLWLRAERAYRQAARAVREETSPHIVSLCLNGIAGCRFGHGDLATAREMLLSSLKFKERCGDLHQIAIARSNLAEVELRLGHAAAALDHARASVRLGEHLHVASDLPDMHRNLAEALLATADPDAALTAALRALELVTRGGARVYLAETAATLAKVCHALLASPVATPAARDRAATAAAALTAVLDQHFDTPELRRKADDLRALLAPALAP